MAYSEILYDVSNKIATITLNRPQALNAWTTVMEGEVRAALTDASADDRSERHYSDRRRAGILLRRRYEQP